MKPIALVRAGAARPFTEVLEGAGAPVESLWERAGLPVGALERPEAALPMRLLEQFVDHAARTQGIDDLGILAAQSGLAALAEHGRAIRSAPTLAEAIRRAQAGQAGWSNGEQLLLVPEGDQVRFLRRRRWDRISSWHGDVFAVRVMLTLVALAAGGDWRPREVGLQSPGHPELAAALERHLGPVRRGCPASGFAFPRAFLARRLDPERGHRPSEREVAPVPGRLPSDLIGALREIGIPLLREGRFSVVAAAEASGTSVRTLQRHLRAGASSFSLLVEQTRFLMATRLLEDSDLRVIDVAMELGYSDPAHFTRAFRRWAAVSPLEYRRSCMAPSDARRTTA